MGTLHKRGIYPSFWDKIKCVFELLPGRAPHTLVSGLGLVSRRGRGTAVGTAEARTCPMRRIGRIFASDASGASLLPRVEGPSLPFAQGSDPTVMCVGPLRI